MEPKILTPREILFEQLNPNYEMDLVVENVELTAPKPIRIVTDPMSSTQDEKGSIDTDIVPELGLDPDNNFDMWTPVDVIRNNSQSDPIEVNDEDSSTEQPSTKTQPDSKQPASKLPVEKSTIIGGAVLLVIALILYAILS